MIQNTMPSYEDTNHIGLLFFFFSVASESLSYKISNNFKVFGGLHIVSKMFGLVKVLKNFHLYELDAHYLSLVENA